MNFILLLVVSLGYGQKQITFQEFNSLETCQMAIKEITKVDNMEAKATCLPK